VKFNMLGIILLSLLFYGCTTSRAVPDRTEQTVYLNGTVLKVNGTEAEIAVNYAEPPETSSYVADLAQKVINKTMFVEGGRTEINGVPVVVRRVVKNILAIKAEKEAPFAQGSAVRISIPKKFVAVVDFEVINAPGSDMGRILLESLTSELVDSGQFVVLERSKLKSVLDEIQLSQSGLTQEPAESMTRKIVNADVLLTGTLAQTGGDWLVNLRLVNVRTAQVISAISYKSPLFKPADSRDASPLSERFEREAFPTWNLGSHGSGQDFFKVSVDRSAGAEESNSSVRVDFDFAKGEIFAHAGSSAKRDLSQFKGVEVDVKGTREMDGTFQLLSSMPDDPNRIDNWAANFEITPQWRKVRIPFDALVVNRKWIKKGAANFGAQTGDQLLRLNRVELVRFGVRGREASSMKGSIWLDNVSFYK